MLDAQIYLRNLPRQTLCSLFRLRITNEGKAKSSTVICASFNPQICDCFPPPIMPVLEILPNVFSHVKAGESKQPIKIFIQVKLLTR